MCRSGLRVLLLAAVLLGLCWAVPSNAIPLAWFGVEEFDTRAVPVLASERLQSSAAAVIAEDPSRASRPPDPSQGDDALAAAVAISAAFAAWGLPGHASARGVPPLASSYHARAPPALS